MSDRGAYMVTWSGRRFYPFDPRPEEVDLDDIAHALAHLCRFAGHTREFYSVAQHSVLVSEACPPEDAFAGLLHDAAEAYVTDLPRPIKHAAALVGYREVEMRVHAAVCERFGLASKLPASVLRADDAVLAAEQRDLAHGSTIAEPPIRELITPWSPRRARAKFLDRFVELALWTALSNSRSRPVYFFLGYNEVGGASGRDE